MSNVNLLKPTKVAKMLDVRPRTVVRWIHEGKIGGVKVGRVWRIPVDDPQLHAMVYRGHDG